MMLFEKLFCFNRRLMVMGVRPIGDHGAPSVEAFVAEVCTQNIEAEHIFEIWQGSAGLSYWIGSL
jgi:hypothetical protein